MTNKVEEEIKKHKNIVIARHVGPDLDALGSAISLKKAIKKKYPDKTVITPGAMPSNFSYIGKGDKELLLEDPLLIVTDTPNLERVDVQDISRYKKIIKLDHHPIIDVFGPYDIVRTDYSSASELIYFFLKEEGYELDKEIATLIYMGIICDTGRFLYAISKYTFGVTDDLVNNYHLNLEEIYENIYMRPLDHYKLESYLTNNFEVTENGLAKIIVEEDILNKYNASMGDIGDVINDYTHINEFLVWVIATYNKRTGNYKVNIRSRGPRVNLISESYCGGGHKFASGVRSITKENVYKLFDDLDEACRSYNENKEC